MTGLPFEKIAIDIAGPFPLMDDENRYIMVCVNIWWNRMPSRIKRSPEQQNCWLKTSVSVMGVPLELHTDLARNSESWVS